MERVVIGATELVDVHTRWSAHAAVVADEHVKVLQMGEGRVRGRRSLFPTSQATKTKKPSGLITGHDSSPFLVRNPVSQEMRASCV